MNFKDIISRSPYVFTIGVAGDSGSGKTTFTNAVREIFGDELVSTITLDDYHILDREGRQKAGITPLHPDANNIALIEEHLEKIKSGVAFEKPVYDHKTGTFAPPVRFTTKKIVILEGLHTLFTPALRKKLDFTIFVDPDPSVKYAWKILRDREKRGYETEDVLNEIEARKKDYTSYIAPQAEYADAIIKIGESRYDTPGVKGGNVYNVALFLKKSDDKVKNITLSIDLFAINSLSDRDFMFEYQVHEISGKQRGSLSFDGELQYEVIKTLEREVEHQTGVHPIPLFEGREYITATDIVQLLLAWKIINKRIFIE